jgi:hypothetical protein
MAPGLTTVNHASDGPREGGEMNQDIFKFLTGSLELDESHENRTRKVYGLGHWLRGFAGRSGMWQTDRQHCDNDGQGLIDPLCQMPGLGWVS